MEKRKPMNRTKEKDQEKKNKATCPNSEQVKAIDTKIWICESCSVISKKTDNILKNLLDLQQELKSMKSNVEEILKTQKNSKSRDTETEKAPPANIKRR